MEEDDNPIAPTTVSPYPADLDPLLEDVTTFAEFCSDIKLRRYQQEAGEAIIDSVLLGKGLSIVVMFPRQSGKNELQAHIEAYLMRMLGNTDAEIVKISPTYKPQTLNAMRRLQRVMEKNLTLNTMWKKESGYIFRVGRARMIFLSGAPEANIVGATASALLEVDEAQDVTIEKFDKEIAPMTASTDATRVFWGTAWTSTTLLGRELRLSREAERADGVRRTFVLSAPDVIKEVPAYGRHVEQQIARLGRNSPMVRTQYFSEEIDAEGGMFPARRLALMQGEHRFQEAPMPGGIYCLLVDVAGEDEGLAETQNLASLRNPGRDSTALTIVQVDLSGLADPLIHAPRYLAVHRRTWIGIRHPKLYAEIKALAEMWRCRWLVIDATGVGAGLASFLSQALPGKVLPFVFNSKTKSELGWNFLNVVDSGRWKETTNFANYRENFAKFPDGARQGRCAENQELLQAQFYNQLAYCQFEIVPGPEKRMRWGVSEGARDPCSGEPVHDDLALSAALCGVLDEQSWSAGKPAAVIQAADPLKSMDKGF